MKFISYKCVVHENKFDKIMKNRCRNNQTFLIFLNILSFFLHIRVVQATVSSSSVDTSDSSKLLETILVQLRPVVLNEVRNSLKTSTYPLDSQSLTIRIVKNLRPFVAEALKNELAKVTKKVTTQVVQQVKTEVQPAVLKVNKQSQLFYTGISASLA